jgi:hypothetical protein
MGKPTHGTKKPNYEKLLLIKNCYNNSPEHKFVYTTIKKNEG